MHWLLNHDNEIFSILQHISTGHGGRDRMRKKIEEKSKDIVRTDILLFINLSAPCQMKQKREKKGIVSKLMIFNDLNPRCQVDLIDYQSHADGKYKFVLVYQYHLTNLVILRPLETKRAEEVAYHLVDIFEIFGAPVVLHGREFCNRVIEELKTMWPELTLVHGKPRYSQSQGSVESRYREHANHMDVGKQNRALESRFKTYTIYGEYFFAFWDKKICI